MIKEIIGREHAELLHHLNSLEPSFPFLSDKHVSEGYWWVAYEDGEPVGFAGMVENIPHVKEGYMKRAYVKPEYRGRGYQRDFLAARALKAQKLGWQCLVSECSPDNHWSAENFRRAGYYRCQPEQPWARPDDLYFVKKL